MKTEAEQAQAMAELITNKDLLDDKGRLAGKVVFGADQLAFALVKAGYGDVSEYKAEIERLKEETSNIRKVTAKEFATRICEMLWNLGVDASGNRFSYGDLTSKEVLYIAKQFGVGIDDCLCKENNIATSHINKLVEQDTEIKKLEQQVKQAQIDTINTIVKYCENPNHWRELKDCKLWGGKSDDLRVFLNGIFKEVDV